MDNGNGLHVVFGAGPVGLAVADELAKRGGRVRLVNRSGRADAPAGVEVVRGDASDPAFTREVSAGASVVYNALTPPTTGGPSFSPAAGRGDRGGRICRGEDGGDGEPVHVRDHGRAADDGGHALRGRHAQRGGPGQDVRGAVRDARGGEGAGHRG